MAINQIPTVPSLPPITRAALPQVQSVPLPTGFQKPYRRRKESETNNLFFDYNNPNQINSFADVLYKNLGDIYSEGEFHIDELLSFGLDLTVDTVNLTNRALIKPLRSGRPEAAVMNGLINVAETLDILANVVKGAILAPSLKEGLYGATLGRVNYDWDSGHLVSDIGLEIVSDPLNWISLGAKAIGEAAVKKSIQELSEEGLAQVQKKLARNVARQFTGDIDSTLKAIQHSTNLLDNVGVESLHRFKNLMVDKHTTTILKATGMARSTVHKIEWTLLNVSTGMAPWAIKNATKGSLYVVRQLTDKFVQGYAQPEQAMNLINFIRKLPELDVDIRDMRQLLEAAEDFPETALQVLGREAVNADMRALGDVFRMFNPKTHDPTVLLRNMNKFAQERMLDGVSTFEDYFQVVSQAHSTARLESTVRELYNRSRIAIEKYRGIEKLDLAQTTKAYLDPILRQFDELSALDHTMFKSNSLAQFFLDDLNKLTMGPLFSKQLKPEFIQWFDEVYDQAEMLTAMYKINPDANDILEELVTLRREFNEMMDVYMETSIFPDPDTAHPLIKRLLKEGPIEPVLHEADQLRAKLKQINADIQHYTMVDYDQTVRRLQTAPNEMLDSILHSGVVKRRAYKELDESIKAQMASGDWGEAIKENIQAVRANFEYVLAGDVANVYKMEIASIEEMIAQADEVWEMGNILDFLEEARSLALRMEHQLLDTREVLSGLPYRTNINDLLDSVDRALVDITADNNIEITKDMLQYVFKQTQAATFGQLYHNDALVQLVDDVYHSGEVSRALHLLAEDHPSAKFVLERAESMHSSLRMFNDIMNNPAFDVEMQDALIDTLHTYAQVPLGRFMENANYYIKDTIRKLSDKLATSKTPRLYKLGAYRAELSEETLARLAVDYGDSLHNATYDVAVNYELVQSLKPYVTASEYPHTSFVVDIETTGSNRFTGDIVQTAVRTPDGVVHNFLVKTQKDATEKVKRVLLGDDLDFNALNEQYDSIFRQHNSDAIAAKYTGAKVQTTLFETEKEMFDELFSIMDKQTVNGTIPVIHGHGFEAFDRPYISRHLQQSRLPNYIKNFEIDDTLIRWRKETGARILTGSEEQAVRDTLDLYLDSRRAEPQLGSLLERVADRLETGKQMVRNNATFIESMDKYLLSNMNDLRSVFKENAENYFDVNVAQAHQNLFGNILSVGQSALAQASDNNKSLMRAYIDRADIPMVYNKLQMDHIFADLPEEARNNKNITHLLMFNQILDGNMVGGQQIGVRKFIDGETINNIVNIDGLQKMSIYQANDVYRAASKIQQYADSIGDISDLGTAEEYVSLQAELIKMLDEVTLSLPQGTYSVIRNLRPDLPVEYLHAQTEYIYRRLASVYNDLKKPIPGWIQDDPAGHFLGNLDAISKASTFKEEYTRFFDVQRLSGSMPEFFEYTKEMHELSQRSARSLEQVLELQDAHGITSPKAKVLSSMYQPTHDALHAFDSYLDELEITWDVGEVKYTAPFHQAPRHAQAAKLKELRMPFDAMDEHVALQGVARFLSLPNEQLLSEMWHHRMGFVVIDQNDLVRTSEDLLTQYKEFVGRLPEQVKLVEFEDRAYFFLDPKHDYSGLPYTKLDGDFDIDVNLGDAEYGLKQVFDKTVEGRRRIVNLGMNANYSTLEHLDYGTLQKVYTHVPVPIRKQMFQLDQLKQLQRFEGSPFNHSILGTIHHRRNFMEYASFNPMKTQLSALEYIHYHTDAQMHYAQMFFDEGYSINADIYRGISDAELAQSVSDSKGGIRMVYLREHSKKGFVVKSIHVNSVDDIAFARKVNAVPMTLDLYNTAKSVLNDDRIDSELLNFLNRNFVYPTKVGYLATAGFPIRNSIDSTLKNIVSTNDVGVLKSMMDAAKISNDYHAIMRQVTQSSQPLSVAIEQFFEAGQTTMDRQLFDMMLQLDTDGTLSGLSKELQDYYGDAIDKLHRRSRHPEVVSVEDLRAYLTGPTSQADMDMRVKFADRPDVIADMEYLKSELHYYKQAAAMKQKTYNKAFDVENLVTYLKRPELVPEELVGEYAELVGKTQHLDFNEALMQKVMHNPGFNMLFDVNNKIEEVARLGLYLHNVQTVGMPKYQAIADVLRTHFDYTHKSMAQQYFEMLFPFSTFATNNFIYWMKELSGTGINAYKMRDVLNPIFNLDEYDEWDINNRRTLQYQILSGNIVLDQETGLTFKMNPSVMDAVGMAYAPVDAVKSRVFAPLRTLAEYGTTERYEWETEEDFAERKNDMLLSTIPIIGPAVLRYKKSQKLQKQFENAFVSALPSVFNKTSVPNQAQKAALGRSQFRYNQGAYYPFSGAGGYFPQGFSYRSGTAWRPYVQYPASLSAFNAVRFSAGGGVRSTYASRQVTRWKRKAWRTHTSTGRSVLGLMMLPANKYTARMRNTLMRKL